MHHLLSRTIGWKLSTLVNAPLSFIRWIDRCTNPVVTFVSFRSELVTIIQSEEG